MLSQLSHVGLAREAVWGTALPAAKFFPSKNPKFEDDIKRILDQGKRGSAATDFGAWGGTRLGRLEHDGDFYPDVPPYFLLGILGQVNTTGVGPYTHVFTLAATPPSFTITDYYGGAQARQFAGAMVESLDLKFATESGALEWAVKLAAKASTQVATPTPTFGSLAPFLGWQAALTLAGGGNTKLLGFELNMKRTLSPIFGANNSQDPNKMYAGPLEVTGKITFDMADETELNYYLNNTQPTLSLVLTSGTNTITIALSKCDFEKATVDRSQEYVRVDSPIRGHYNATDAGPAKITVVNSVASYAA